MTLDRFGLDIAWRSRWALDHNDGYPSGAWSTGEQLAVALVLFNRQHLADMDYSATEAAQRIAAEVDGDFSAWLNAIRAQLD